MSSKNNQEKIKNIVIVNDFDYVQGGASKVAIDTANLLSKNNNGVEIYFFSAAHNDSSNLESSVKKNCTFQGEALRDKNKLRGIINGIYNFKAKREFKKLLGNLDRNETVIHVHGWTKCLSSSIFDIAFKLKFKVVLTMHDYFTACPNGGYFNYKFNKICKLNPLSMKCIKCNCDSRNYVFKLYRVIRQFVQNKIVKLNKRLTDVISISNFSENILRKTLDSNTKIHRVYNPIDLDLTQEKVNYKNNSYYLYVGRVSKEKGVDIFCESISSLGLKGVIVGDGDQKDVLQQKYPNIDFAGWKNSSEVKEYMKKARALIFPSRWYEAAPLTPLEAMQYGIPCYTSDCCATIDYITTKNNGIIFSSVEDLKNKIIENEKTDFRVNIDFYKEKNYIAELMNCYNNLGRGNN